jgi:hypothetical protein
MGFFNIFTRRQNANTRQPNNTSKKGFFKSMKNRFTKTTPAAPKTPTQLNENLQLLKDLKSLTPEQKVGFLNLGKQLDTNPSELVIPRYLVKPVLISIKILIIIISINSYFLSSILCYSFKFL